MSRESLKKAQDRIDKELLPRQSYLQDWKRAAQADSNRAQEKHEEQDRAIRQLSLENANLTQALAEANKKISNQKILLDSVDYWPAKMPKDKSSQTDRMTPAIPAEAQPAETETRALVNSGAKSVQDASRTSALPASDSSASESSSLSTRAPQVLMGARNTTPIFYSIFGALARLNMNVFLGFGIN
jgi:hypothetical protein